MGSRYLQHPALRIIFCAGNFDLFHAGHVRFFKRVSVYGRVVACVNTDEFAASYKRPTIMTLSERLECVRGCRFVTDVYTVADRSEYRTRILESGASHVAHGNDWMGESLLEQLGLDQTWLDENHVQMLYVPYTHGVSTTELIERCRRSDVMDAGPGLTVTNGSVPTADINGLSSTAGSAKHNSTTL